MYWNRVKKGYRKGRGLSFQRLVQLIATAVLNGYVIGFREGKIFTGKSKAFCVPVLNCYSCPGALGACPIGAIQSMLGANHCFPFYVFGLLMLFGIVLGRIVCGFLCPFGLVQDLLYKIPVPKWKVPKKIDKMARFLKYIVLLLPVLILPAWIANETGVTPPYFCKYICPAGTLGGGIPLMAANPALRGLAGSLFHWKLGVLLVILALSVVIHRPFCKYLCPLGAFYSLFNRFSFYQMHRDEAKCTGCKTCEKACPMNVTVTETTNSPECIRCGKCKFVCPSHAISSGFGGKREKSAVGEKRGKLIIDEAGETERKEKDGNQTHETGG